jgi:eukaryotic-like serine/threonine-protein kinase
LTPDGLDLIILLSPVGYGVHSSLPDSFAAQQQECNMTSDAPQRLGDYEILKVLGAGGMGRVYQVRNVITDRVEAMKVLLPEIGGQEEVAARFLREIKVLAALNHPHIARLHTALTIDNQLVMIMEFVEGQAISGRLGSGPIPVPDALTYIDQVLDALSYAHQQHVIHRDIKPANMMLTPDGTVKLMDFGIARTESEPTLLTAPGSTLGSMNYMSPEQVKGERTDERSDLYSLGISLYEMVTGERPFHGDSSFSLMAAHINQAPTPPVELQPEMPAGLNQIILTSIAKSPAERFQSADAFRNAVKTVLRDLQESKTMVQGSQDATAAGSRTPLPHVRTGPITRPKTQSPAPVPVSAAVTASSAVTAGTAARPAASTVVGPPPPGPARPVSNRGLLISLGAVVVLVVLVAAGLYIPRGKKASAAAESSGATKQPPVVETKPAEAALPPEPTKAAKKKPTGDRLSAGDAQAAAAEAAAARARAEALDRIEHEIDQLTGRAASVNSSVENLQRQQEAMGVGLRGDVAQHLASMKVNLAKAQDAVSRTDIERAKRYAALADADVEALEKFMGR